VVKGARHQRSRSEKRRAPLPAEFFGSAMIGGQRRAASRFIVAHPSAPLPTLHDIEDD
jgi:hypothetical protein